MILARARQAPVVSGKPRASGDDPAVKKQQRRKMK